MSAEGRSGGGETRRGVGVSAEGRSGGGGGGWEEDKEGRGTQMDGERQGSGVCEREKGEPYSQPGVHVTPPSTPPPLNPILYFGTPIPPVKLME